MKMLLLASICFILAGCTKHYRNYELDARSFTPEYIKFVEQRIGITIPAGSRGLNMYNAQAEIDPSFMAKIAIPDTSAESFIKELKKIPNDSVVVTNYLSEKLTWWKPSKDSVRIERRFFRSPGNDFVDILLCEENGQPVLYINWLSR